jgi:hypothetical protein
MLCGLVRGCRQPGGGQFYRRNAVRDGLKNILGALAEPADGLLNDGAARFLLAQ